MHAELIVVLVIAAFFIGLSKAGFSGVSLIAVFLMTEYFGAKEQIGLALPMLIMADVIVYPAFRKHGSWKPVFVLLPPTLIGIALAMWVLHSVSNETMRSVIGGVILCMVAMQLLRKWAPQRFQKLAESHSFGMVAGATGGVATMLANAAGPIMQLYLLSQKMPKMDLIGVGARFFLVVNILKLPLTAGMSLTTWETLKWNVAVLPMIVVGVYLGKHLLHKIPQKWFEGLIVCFATLAGMRLLF